MSLLAVLIFLLPTQLGLHFWPDFTHIFGIRVDYFSPTIYLTDIIVGVLIVNFLIKQKGEFLKFIFRYKLFVLGLLIFSILNILFSLNILVSLVKWFKVYEVIFLAFVIANIKISWVKDIVKPFSLSLILFSIIGLLQVLKGSSVGGMFYFLGERNFSINTPGISLVQIFGQNYLREYSTFSHPNSLAGYFLVSLIILLLTWPSKRLGRPKSAVILFSAVAIVLSFSLTVYIASIAISVLFMLLRLNKKLFTRVTFLLVFLIIIVSLVMPLISGSLASHFRSREIYERLWLNFAAGEFVARSTLLGIGLNNFISLLPTTSIPKSVIWNLQPAHNIFLLVFAETGIVGLLLLSYSIFRVVSGLVKKGNLEFIIPIMAILITGLGDHYWLTLQQNMLLVAIVVGLSFRKTTV